MLKKLSEEKKEKLVKNKISIVIDELLYILRYIKFKKFKDLKKIYV